MKRLKSLSLAVVSVLFAATFAFAVGEKSVESPQTSADVLKEGYRAAKAEKFDSAASYFEQSGNMAKEEKNWKALLDAGTGLSNLGRPERGADFLDDAYNLIRDSQDWQKLVATGYALAALPQKEGGVKKARTCFTLAGKASMPGRKWKGLVQAGNGLLSIGEKQRAIQFYNEAFSYVSAPLDREAVEELEECYTAVNDYGKLAKCRQMLGQKAEPVKTPEGWNPAGNTIAKPKEISQADKEGINAAAETEIAEKDEYIRQREEEKKGIYSDDYYYYYGYPWAMFDSGSCYASAYVVRRKYKKLSNGQIIVWAQRMLIE